MHIAHFNMTVLIFMYLFGEVAGECHSTCVEVRGQYAEVGSFSPPCRSRGSNSGCQAWGQTPLPSELSLWPYMHLKF